MSIHELTIDYTFRLGEIWEIDLNFYTITGPNGTTSVEPRIMEVLVYLALHAGTAISRNELMNQIWSEAYVTDNNLSVAVSTLRKIFRDGGEENAIETVRNVGYKLNLEVSEIAETVPGTEREKSHSDSSATGRETGLPATPDNDRNGQSCISQYLLAAGIGFLLATLAFYFKIPLSARDLGSFDYIDKVLDSDLFTPVAGSNYFDEHPAYSKSNNLVAYTSRYESDRSDILIKRPGGTKPVLFTENEEEIPMYQEEMPAWSPNGDRLAFFRYTGNECRLVEKTFPEMSERILTRCTKFNPLSSLDWSSDGRYLVFSDQSSTSGSNALFLLDYETLSVRQISFPGRGIPGDYLPRFSADRQSIYFVRATLDNYHLPDMIPAYGTLHKLDIETGECMQMTDRPALISGFQEVNGSIILSDITWDKTSFRNISPGDRSVALRYIEKNGLYRNFSLSDPPEKAFTERWDVTYSIYAVDKHPEHAGQLPDDYLMNSIFWDWDATFNTRGDRVSFVSNRSKSSELWVASVTGDNIFKLDAIDRGTFHHPSWSPDDKAIAIESHFHHNSDIHLVPSGGGESRTLTAGPSIDLFPSWSADGSIIYYASDSTGRFEIWKAPADGGEAVQVTENAGLVSKEMNIHGKPHLLFTRPGLDGIWMKPAEGGETDLLVGDISRYDYTRWTVANGNIYYISDSTGNAPAVIKLEPETGNTTSVRQLNPALKKPFITALTVSPVNEEILLTYAEANSNIIQFSLNSADIE